ncbi:MAG: hypothetical protein DRQ78_12315 [Epsilonproteobacteria bacterium]|nr:MAG: hypothetical protein DRQ78_12315 [Campylobacterota bacterium]
MFVKLNVSTKVVSKGRKKPTLCMAGDVVEVTDKIGAGLIKAGLGVDPESQVDNGVLSSEIETLQSELSSMQGEFLALQQDMSEVQSELDSANKKVESLEAELLECQKNNEPNLLDEANK